MLPTHPVSVRLRDVLYVPTLGHSLLSWNQLKHKLRLSGHGKYMTVTTIDNSPMFNIEFRGSLPDVTSLIAQTSDHQVSSQAPSESMLAKAHF